MTTRCSAGLGLLAAAAGLAAGTDLAAAGTFGPITLPAPRADFGTSLAQALKLRRSIREFDRRLLPARVLSELLWCAYGVNRAATADRIAPSWRHARETEIFAAMADGTWRYDPIGHRLLPHLPADIRPQTACRTLSAARRSISSMSPMLRI